MIVNKIVRCIGNCDQVLEKIKGDCQLKTMTIWLNLSSLAIQELEKQILYQGFAQANKNKKYSFDSIMLPQLVLILVWKL